LRRGPLVLAAGSTVACHVAAALFFAAHDPYETQILPPCPVLQLTGWQCPGCGGTRAMYSLLHGDVVQAVAMNPLLPALYLAGGLMIASAISAARARHRLGNRLALAALGVVVTAGLYAAVVRNLLA